MGGTGFIGSHVVDLLSSRKKRITVVGRNPAPTRCFSKNVRYVAGDYGKRSFLVKILRDVNEVIHLAYASVPKTSYEDPVHDIFDNLPATVRLLEIASSYDVEKFVLVSSGGTIYGKTQEVPISEEHQTNPISPYGITKLTTEKYALMFNELNAIPVVCVRPANAYGERQKPFVGQGFVATAIVSILMGQEINLFGKSGTIRDYIHVTDVANGIVAALEHGMPGSCYNIGSGVGRSNNDVLDAIYPFAKMSNLECKTKILPPRSFDVPVNVLCSKKITNDTDWKRVVSFEEGIERTWKWYYRKYYIRT